MTPTGHAGLGRTPSGLCEPQPWRNPPPEPAQWVKDSEDSHTLTVLPRRRNEAAKLEPRLGRGPARAPRATEGKRDVRSAPSPPPQGKGILRTAPSRPWRGAPNEEATRQRRRRGQREKEGHSPASAPSPYSTGNSHRPVARVRKRGVTSSPPIGVECYHVAGNISSRTALTPPCAPEQFTWPQRCLGDATWSLVLL